MQKDLVQSMVDGVCGPNGHIVPKAVDLELKKRQDDAITQYQDLVASIVLERV